MAARKSQLFLSSVLPVTKTHDDVVREKFKPGKFFFTYTGFIKIAGYVCLLTSMAVTLGTSYCENDKTYRYLAWVSLAVTIGISLCLYLIFCFGMAVKRPSLWVKTDIICNFILSVFVIVCSAICMSTCNTFNDSHEVPGPLGMTGGLVLIIGCAALFLLYRYREDENEEVDNVQAPNPAISRKSIFA